MGDKPLKLKVSEALSKDVGRAYARMGPEDLLRLRVEVGDIVEVAGKARTVCNTKRMSSGARCPGSPPRRSRR